MERTLLNLSNEGMVQPKDMEFVQWLNEAPIFSPFSKKFEVLEPEVKLKGEEKEVPKVELKALPSHLQYAYLGSNSSYPVIMSSSLNEDQQRRLLDVL